MKKIMNRSKKRGPIIAAIRNHSLIGPIPPLLEPERRSEIGILRSLGATRGQIAGLFAGEAALLGLVGALGGVPSGAALANFGLGFIEQVLTDIFVPLEARPPVVTAAIFAAAVVAGLLTALLAALVPAIQASLHEPADVVRAVEDYCREVREGAFPAAEHGFR